MGSRIRRIVGFQVLSTAAVASIAAWLAGVHGVISAALGGLIGIVAGLVFAVLASKNKARSAGEVLSAALRAEAAKLVLGIALLWLVLVTYHDVVVAGLIGSFVVSILIFGMALFIRET